MQSFFELIPVLVGSIFAALGFFLLKNQLSLRANGTSVPGEVTAIEKYVSHMRTGGQRSSTLMYRPVVTYIYEGEAHEVRGYSVNNLRHRLGQKLEVMVRKKADDNELEADVKDVLGVGMPLLFLALGLGAVGLGATLQTATPLKTVLVLVVVLVVGFFVERAPQSGGASSAKNSPPVSATDLVVITTPQQLKDEVKVHQVVGYLICLVGLGVGVWFWYLGASQLSPQEYSMLFSHPSELLESSTAKRPAVLCGIGAFTMLVSLFSIIMQTRQYGFLLRR